MTATMPSSKTLAKSTGSSQCEISMMFFVTASNLEIGKEHKPEACDYTNHTRDALGHQKNDPPVALPPRRARGGFRWFDITQLVRAAHSSLWVWPSTWVASQRLESRGPFSMLECTNWRAPGWRSPLFPTVSVARSER